MTTNNINDYSLSNHHTLTNDLNSISTSTITSPPQYTYQFPQKIKLPLIDKEKFDIVSNLLKKDLITSAEALILLKQEYYEISNYQPSYQSPYHSYPNFPDNPYRVIGDNTSIYGDKI